MKKIAWDRNPKINWWLENDPVRFYHNITLSNLPIVSKEGIKAATSGPEAGNVSLFLEPNSAIVKKEDQAILIVDLPLRWMFSHMSRRMDGEKNRLTNKDQYEKWTRTDHEYYKGSMLRIRNLVPRRFIVGFTVVK